MTNELDNRNETLLVLEGRKMLDCGRVRPAMKSDLYFESVHHREGRRVPPEFTTHGRAGSRCSAAQQGERIAS